MNRLQSWCHAAFILTCVLATHVVETKPATTRLNPEARIHVAAVKESSGIVASRRYPGVFWTHNDSGDTARLFAFHRDGSAVSKDLDDYRGVNILGATNRDWEDIAIGEDGTMYVGDIGNNNSTRRDLAIYVVAEPDPEASLNITLFKRAPFAYPDQTAFPPKPPNFDAEALFWADGTLWLLSKHHGDRRTTLYRFNSLRTDQTNVLARVEEFATDFPVSAADASADGKRLAVLTNQSIWVFERGAIGASWFAGRHWHERIHAGNAEAICWDGDDLVLTNEARDIFVVHLEELRASAADS
jgi:hypothetical protein